MKPLEQWASFGEMIFTVLLIAGTIFFVVLTNRFYFISQFLKQMLPVFVIFGAYLLKNNIDKFNSRRSDRATRSIVIDIDYYFLFITNLAMFGTPILILLIGYMISGSVDADDMVQAAISFIVFYLWQRAILRGND
jgi:hypothetical protein